MEATAGPRQILASTEVCARHLGDSVQELAAWARDTGLHGQITVLAIGEPEPRRHAAKPDHPGRQLPNSVPFSIIPIDPLTTNSQPDYVHASRADREVDAYSGNLFRFAPRVSGVAVLTTGPGEAIEWAG